MKDVMLLKVGLTENLSDAKWGSFFLENHSLVFLSFVEMYGEQQ